MIAGESAGGMAGESAEGGEGGSGGGDGKVLSYSHVSFALAHLERLELLGETVNAPARTLHDR